MNKVVLEDGRTFDLARSASLRFKLLVRSVGEFPPTSISNDIEISDKSFPEDILLLREILGAMPATVRTENQILSAGPG